MKKGRGDELHWYCWLYMYCEPEGSSVNESTRQMTAPAWLQMFIIATSAAMCLWGFLLFFFNNLKCKWHKQIKTCWILFTVYNLENRFSPSVVGLFWLSLCFLPKALWLKGSAQYLCCSFLDWDLFRGVFHFDFEGSSPYYACMCLYTVLVSRRAFTAQNLILPLSWHLRTYLICCNYLASFPVIYLRFSFACNISRYL